MKTKKDFLKENIGISAIWNIPMMIIISIPISDLFSELFKTICIMIVVYVILVFRSIDTWYNEDKIFELEQQIKQL